MPDEKNKSIQPSGQVPSNKPPSPVNPSVPANQQQPATGTAVGGAKQQPAAGATVGDAKQQPAVGTTVEGAKQPPATGTAVGDVKQPPATGTAVGNAKQPPGLPSTQLRPPESVRPPASKASFKRRHFGVLVSFFLLVAVPIGAASYYLWALAADQYASYLGFSVRSESNAMSSEALGGLGAVVGLSNNSSSDTDILYEFIQSHDLVQRIDDRLDLRTIWSKAPQDIVFSYSGNGTLENLLGEWENKVNVYYDNGLLELRVLAFDPHDAQSIAQAILEESTVLINQLNDVAREDTLRYASKDLEAALERLKEARAAVTAFRNHHQLVDPTADVEGQVGVVASLQQQLATDLVNLGMLRANAAEGDPRIQQTELRINVIRQQIEDERTKFGSETASGEALSEVVGQYESLAVDREFAEQTYIAALAAYDAARADASRQTRYLAAYVKPTLAQQAEYPERVKLMLILGGFLVLIWITGVLIYFSLRDRR